MQILVTGGTGFIGSALLKTLHAQDHQLLVLSRGNHQNTPGCRYIQSLDQVDSGEVLGAIINLAGASLAASRWTQVYKREIIDSRLQTTSGLVALCKRLDTPPSVLLSASAIGYYGHHGDEALDEKGESVPGFSQKLCADWETAANQAASLGVRVCALRLGVVLDAEGGALQEMARSFSFGVGSWIGNGRQWLSWIHRADVVRSIEFLLEQDDARGPFNLTAPGAVTAQDFCEALTRHHRVLFSAGVPAPVIRLLVGEMADELLLNGQRVVPRALQEAGFSFSYPTVDEALANIYER